MAKVYSAPIQPPEISTADLVGGEWQKKESDYLAELAKLAKEQAVARGEKLHKLIGEIVTTPIADGQAVYMVWSAKPFSLIHVPIGDAWAAPAAWERGLTITDAKKQVEWRENWAKMVSEKKKGVAA